MKLFLILFCCPFFATAQLTGRPDDSLRKVSDTMHFPKPFVFKMSANTKLSQAELAKKCNNWIDFLKDSLKSIVVQKDPAKRKIAASNVPATADISFTILIAVKGVGYTCTLQDYLFHSINGKRLPVDKAAMMKDYKETTGVEKVIIMRTYQGVFDSLNRYLE